jgi:hypothetical protein
VAELLSISDVCVLSSKAEGFSNSILEYMAAGKPVVATDVGGREGSDQRRNHWIPSEVWRRQRNGEQDYSTVE